MQNRNVLIKNVLKANDVGRSSSATEEPPHQEVLGGHRKMARVSLVVLLLCALAPAAILGAKIKSEELRGKDFREKVRHAFHFRPALLWPWYVKAGENVDGHAGNRQRRHLGRSLLCPVVRTLQGVVSRLEEVRRGRWPINQGWAGAVSPTFAPGTTCFPHAVHLATASSRLPHWCPPLGYRRWLSDPPVRAGGL